MNALKDLSGDSQVEYIELYMHEPSTRLKYYPENDSWVSKLDKMGDAKNIFKMESKLYLIENTGGEFKCNVFEDKSRIRNFMSSKFEKALTITGPFPFSVIRNYLNLVQYRDFANRPETDDIQNAYSPRDFSIGLALYLEYCSKSIASIEASYKVGISTRIELLKCEVAEIGAMKTSLKLTRKF